MARFADVVARLRVQHLPGGVRLGVADLEQALALAGREETPGFGNASVTMWAWGTEDAEEERRVLHDLLSPLLGRDPNELATQLCVGPASRCQELVAQYAEAGCTRIHFGPVGDEPGQVELLASRVTR